MSEQVRVQPVQRSVEQRKFIAYNLVEQHKKMAQGFLRQLIENKKVPRNFSGIMTPKFGDFVMIWQFDKNKLIGASAVHANNIDNLIAKLKYSLSIDFLGGNIDTGGLPDTDNAIGLESREAVVRVSDAGQGTDLVSNVEDQP
jgi:hypothetical protein